MIKFISPILRRVHIIAKNRLLDMSGLFVCLSIRPIQQRGS